MANATARKVTEETYNSDEVKANFFHTEHDKVKLYHPNSNEPVYLPLVHLAQWEEMGLTREPPNVAEKPFIECDICGKHVEYNSERIIPEGERQVKALHWANVMHKFSRHHGDAMIDLTNEEYDRAKAMRSRKS